MDDALVNATGKALGDWFAVLDGHDARELPHKDIARLLQDEYGVSGWWSQNVTVEYEKHIGRRETGQTQAGDYETTVTRTLPGDMDAVLDRWVAHVSEEGAPAAFDGVRFAGDPGISRTEKWRYWRVALADGTRVTVTISDKPRPATNAAHPAAILAVTSSKLRTRDDGERWKAFWRRYLAALQGAAPSRRRS
jgi:hypothetical protein